MNKLLETIFETQKFQNSNNQTVEIHSETSKKQCEFFFHNNQFPTISSNEIAKMVVVSF